MKTKLTIILSAILLTTLSFQGVQSKGLNSINKEERSVSSFTSINLQLSANVYLKQGSKQSIVIEANENLLENIETVVENNTLKIKFKKRFNHNKEKASIYITIPDINKLTLSGSGKIIAENTIKTDKMDLSISGSGSIQLNDINANDINSRISGSGSISLSGKEVVKAHTINISGSGNIKSTELEVENLNARISGSGNCKVYVTKDLDAVVSGSGNIYYKGKPLINANVSGSGNIKSLD